MYTFQGICTVFGFTSNLNIHARSKIYFKSWFLPHSKSNYILSSSVPISQHPSHFYGHLKWQWTIYCNFSPNIVGVYNSFVAGIEFQIIQAILRKWYIVSILETLMVRIEWNGIIFIWNIHQDEAFQMMNY